MTLPLNAEVEPQVIKLLGSGRQTHTVPDNQVFIIDSVVWDAVSGSPNGAANFTLLSPGVDDLGDVSGPTDARLTRIVLSAQATDQLLVPLTQPLHIPEGFTLALPTGDNSTVVIPTTSFTFFGRLVDETDLFAQVGADLQNPQLANGQLKAEFTPITNRPSRVVVEKSMDLENFQPVDAEITPVDGSDALVSLAVDDMDADQLFIRARTQLRPRN